MAGPDQVYDIEIRNIDSMFNIILTGFMTSGKTPDQITLDIIGRIENNPDFYTGTALSAKRKEMR